MQSSRSRAAFFVSGIQPLPRFFTQSESTHITSLVSIEPSTCAGSIMVLYAQRDMEGELSLSPKQQAV